MVQTLTKERATGMPEKQLPVTGKRTLSIIDNRTGKEFEIPIRYGTYPTYGASIDCMEQ